MIQLIFQGTFLLSLVVAIIYMLKVRRAGNQNPAMTDGLTIGERILAIFTIFFGGVIVVGAIFYYGWEKRFPLKARSIRHMVWVFLAIDLLILLGGWYWYTNFVLPIQQQIAIDRAQVMLDERKLEQKQELQEQEASLASGSSEIYQGDGFSIKVPSGWREDALYAQSGWASFGEAKVWSTNDGDQSLNVVWNTDTLNKLTTIEDINKNDALSFPADYVISYPTVLGAKQAILIYPTKVLSDGYTIQLFAHGGGKIYYVNATLEGGTSEQAENFRKLVLSFALQ